MNDLPSSTAAGRGAGTQADPVLVRADNLPVYCPGPQAPLWSMHPRVYISLNEAGRGTCPYCSAVYQLEGGALPHGH